MKKETRDSLVRYAEDHIETGGFLRAVLVNDFMEAVGRADADNARDLCEIARFIWNDIPARCHGSYTIVNEWIMESPAAKGGA